MRTLLAPTCACLLTLGCGGGATSQPTASSAATDPAATNANEAEAVPTPAPPPPSTAASTFEVHEWGFVDVPQSGATELGAGPGQPSTDMPMTVRKPVVYVHADPGTTTPPLDVVARFPSGELLEVWPTRSEWPSTQSDVSSIHWTGLAIGPCDASASALATTQREARGCATLDGYCEVNDLPTYVTTDASCLAANGVSAPLLFYRGRTSTATLPLRVTDDGATVHLESSALGGSSVLHVRDGVGSETAWPANGTSVTTPAQRTLDGAALATRLSSMLVAAGLTQPEADAFLRAWSSPLFGVPWPASQAGTRDEPARRGPARGLAPLPAPYVLYILPEASVPALAELTITPAPRVVRRVMVVRVELTR
jgi:hypothetical protein